MSTRSRLAWTWIVRLTMGPVAIVTLTVAVLFVVFSSWEATHGRDIETNSRVMTTVLGDIEYAVVGTGVPHLSIHGTRQSSYLIANIASSGRPVV